MTFALAPGEPVPVVIPPLLNGHANALVAAPITDVEAFYCFTDGVAQGSLPRFLQNLAGKPPDLAERLLRQLRLRSADDKALLVGKRAASPAQGARRWR